LGNCLQTKNKNKSLNPRGRPVNAIITPELVPVIFRASIKGLSTQQIVNLLAEKYDKHISRSGIWQYRNDHKEEYDEFRKEWLADLKAVPLANARCRIVELQRTYLKLKKKLDEIIDTVAPSQWDRINLAGLLREANKMLEQIQDEAGDKVHKYEGKGNGSFIFGDQTINVFADGVLSERQKDTVDLRDQLKKNRFFDSGSSVSDN